MTVSSSFIILSCFIFEYSRRFLLELLSNAYSKCLKVSQDIL